MANCNIRFMRIDTRMVHGQIVVKWATVNKCKYAIIVDKALAADPFMSSFYRKATQKGIKVDVADPVEAAQQWKADSFGPSERNVMLIFKDTSNAYKLWKEGFPVEELNLGNQVAAKGKKQISREVFLTQSELYMLKEMYESGIRVYMQVIPNEPPLEFPSVEKIFQSL